MGKYDLTGFKKKITPRGKDEIQEKAANRFANADNTLGVATIEQQDQQCLNVKKDVCRVVRKTFSIPENELMLFDKIKDRALDLKIVLAESEVIRLGLSILCELPERELEKASKKLVRMQAGRPSQKKPRK